MTQRLEDFAAEQRVSGDVDLAREIYDLLTDAEELVDWHTLTDSFSETKRLLDEGEAIVAELERCETLQWDEAKPAKSLKVGLKGMERQCDALGDIRDLLHRGGYLERPDDMRTDLAALIACFMPPLHD